MDIKKNVAGAIDMAGIIIDVVLFVSLIPVVVTFIASAENLSAVETTLLSLVTLFLVLGLVFMVGKQSGLIKGK